MSTDAAGRREVVRGRDRIVAGVASGYARHWGVEATVVRAAIGLLTLVGGVGAVLYLLGLLATSPVPAAAEAEHAVPVPDHRRELAIGAATLAVLVVVREIGIWPGDRVMIPATLVAVAVAVMWTPDRSRRSGSLVGVLTGRPGRVVVGAVLAITGVAALAERTGGLDNVGRSASAIAIALAGAGVIAAPAIGRLLGRLDEERMLRVREEERATLAVHLHDSVLQSLVLIQRADEPRRMAGLARRQERELRAWLYGGQPLGEPATLAAAVEAATASIEADHGVRVDVVAVGNVPLDEPARTLLGAVREAAVNAARHSGAAQVDVYVEVEPDELVAFVRDTGRGFDPATIAADRRGVAESIVGRAERAGGRVAFTSAPTVGTEVEIHVPRRSGR